MTYKVSFSTLRLQGRLLLRTPSERYRWTGGKNAKPTRDDIIRLDQGFAGENRKPMTLVYGFDDAGEEAYKSKSYSSEFEPIGSDKPDQG